MKDYVFQLSEMVSGGAEANAGRGGQALRRPKTKVPQTVSRPTTGKKLLFHRKSASEVSPEQVIPMGDEGFKNF